MRIRRFWISPKEHFGNAFGKVDKELTQLIVKADTDGKYNVLAVATRKDAAVKDSFDRLGVEYQDSNR